MGAAPRGRALPVATAIVGAAVAAVAVAAGAAAARVAVAGGAAAASAVKPEVVDVGGATVDAGSAVRVVGGEVVQDGDWEGTQFMVKLLRSEPGGFRFKCGGMLFRPNKVITAAHCIGEEKSLRVGDLAHVGGLTFKQGLSSRIESIVVHPDWDPVTKRADIAVLTLANPRTTAKYDTINVRKMGINRDSSVPAVGTVLTFAGWGQTSGREGGESVTRLRRANVTVAAWEDCVATGIARRAPLPDGLEAFALCTSGAAEGTSACGGDSGGPLYYRDRSPTGRLVYRVAGISSFVLGDKEDPKTNTVRDDCPPGTLSYFTRVSAFASWIDEQMDPGWQGWGKAP